MVRAVAVQVGFSAYKSLLKYEAAFFLTIMIGANMKPTLLVLAAGMGSRYGGVKQIDAVGKNGECLLDLSLIHI